MQAPQAGCHLLPERLDVDRERHGLLRTSKGRGGAAREVFPKTACPADLVANRQGCAELKRPVAPQLPR